MAALELCLYGRLFHSFRVSLHFLSFSNVLLLVSSEENNYTFEEKGLFFFERDKYITHLLYLSL